MAHAGRDALRLTQMSAGPETLSSHVVYYLTRRESWSLSRRRAVVCCVGYTLNRLHNIYLYFKILVLISVFHFYATVLCQGRESMVTLTFKMFYKNCNVATTQLCKAEATTQPATTVKRH